MTKFSSKIPYMNLDDRQIFCVDDNLGSNTHTVFLSTKRYNVSLETSFWTK